MLQTLWRQLSEKAPFMTSIPIFWEHLKTEIMYEFFIHQPVPNFQKLFLYTKDAISGRTTNTV